MSGTLDKDYNGNHYIYDYQFNFGSRLNVRIAVVFIVNLISNIGFSVDLTYITSGVVLVNMIAEEMGFILKHPDVFP